MFPTHTQTNLSMFPTHTQTDLSMCPTHKKQTILKSKHRCKHIGCAQGQTDVPRMNNMVSEKKTGFHNLVLRAK